MDSATDPANKLQQLLCRANAAVSARQLDEAATLLEQAAEIDDSDLYLLDLFGFVRFFQQRYAEAEQHCRRALALDPQRPYALKGLGLCLARQGRLDEGIEQLERAIAAKPDWLDPRWDLAVALFEGGRHQQAAEVLEEAHSRFPQHRSRIAGLLAQLQQQSPLSSGG